MKLSTIVGFLVFFTTDGARIDRRSFESIAENDSEGSLELIAENDSEGRPLGRRVACEYQSHLTFQECKQPSFNSCHGQVWYGYRGHWVNRIVQGNFQCNTRFFGKDPFPGQAKECICSDSASSAQRIVHREGQPGGRRVACENPRHATFRECQQHNLGTCNGLVWYGYGKEWTKRQVRGVFHCNSKFFGVDPFPGQAKECLCKEVADSPYSLQRPQSGHVPDINVLAAFFKSREGLNLFFGSDARKRARKEINNNPHLRVQKLKKLTALFRTRESLNLFFTGDACKKALVVLKQQSRFSVAKMTSLTAYYRSPQGGNNFFTGDAAKKALFHMTSNYGPYLDVPSFRRNKQMAIETAKQVAYQKSHPDQRPTPVYPDQWPTPVRPIGHQGRSRLAGYVSYRKTCYGRNELGSSKGSTLNGCKRKCDLKAACVSFELSANGICQLSSSCRMYTLDQGEFVGGQTWKTYVKNAGYRAGPGR